MMRHRLRSKPVIWPSAFPRIHFIGIGGVGMSGIAEVMLTLGYKVSGSDQNDSPSATRRLVAYGCESVCVDMRPAILKMSMCVVVSSAIKADQSPNSQQAHAQPHSGGAARRDARRADALQARYRDRRYARQNYDYLADRQRVQFEGGISIRLS